MAAESAGERRRVSRALVKLPVSTPPNEAAEVDRFPCIDIVIETIIQNDFIMDATARSVRPEACYHAKKEGERMDASGSLQSF